MSDREPSIAERWPSGGPARNSRLLVLYGVCLLAGVGCQQARYDARRLPPELAAPLNTSTQKLDLTGLAQDSTRTTTIQVGDVLDVVIATGTEEESPPVWPLRVDQFGMIQVPLVGDVQVADFDINAVGHQIEQACIDRQIYRNPQVSVTFNERHENKVTVIGAVNEPGTYSLLASNSNLLSAIVAAGGLTEEASSIVEIRQPTSIDENSGYSQIQQASYRPRRRQRTLLNRKVDLKVATAGTQEDLAIDDGAVIMVVNKDPQSIFVMGLVHRPDQYEIKDGEDLRVLDAIAMAGGRTMEIADKVEVVRSDTTTGKSVVIAVSVNEAKANAASNLRLAPGDVVSVEETPLTFAVDTFRQLFRVALNSTTFGL